MMMSLRVSFLSCAALLAIACSKPNADKKDEPLAASTSGANANAGAQVAAAPADPAAEFPQLAASCATVKNLGECSEYKEIGLLGDTIKSLCEDAKGTYSTSARCPKDGRIAVCSTDVKKVFYYKEVLEISKPADLAKFCKDALLGTYVDIAKPEAQGSAPSKKSK
jgi:hypothetical protein